MTRQLHILRWTGLLLVFLALWAFRAPGAAQAQTTGWSDPLNLFETEGRASEAEVVADPSGAVHVFWAYNAPGEEDTGASQAIYYALKDGESWSEPVDILVSPDGRVARMQAVTSDKQGYLHIVWSGGNAIFYSRAYALEASSAQGWSYPEPLTANVSALDPAIAEDGAYGIYVLWTQAFAGLMFTQSQDSGQTWSIPQAIFQAAGNNELARQGRIAVDQKGRLHVVFSHYLEESSGTGDLSTPISLYYLRSEDRGATWSEPLLMTPEPDFGEINVATCGDDTIHLVWNGRAGRRGRYHRISQDGGETWSSVTEVLAPSPQNPIGTGGLTGFPVIACDSTEAVHLVSATGRGMYYFTWRNGAWSQAEYASRGVAGGGVTGTAESIEEPSLTLSQGNLLHLVFHEGFERIWYVTRQADAPRQEVTPLPTVPVVPTPAATSFPPPTIPPVPQPQATSRLDAAGAAPAPTSTVTPLLLGVLPVVLLISGTVLAYQIRRRPR